MNITFLIQDITTRGGTERTTCCLANTFAEYGHNVSIVSIFRNEKSSAYLLNQNIKVDYINNDIYNIELGIVNRLFKIIKSRKKIHFSHILQNADIIIGQKILASFLLSISGFSSKSIACEHFKYEMYNTPLRFIRNCIYKKFKCVVVLTNNDKEKFSQTLSNIEVIPNMISVTPVKNNGKNSKRLITVGRLNYQKGYDLLLKALPKVFEQAPDWHLDIFGDGEDLNMLLKLREQLKLTNFVNFRGYIDNIEDEYAKSSFFVMSSRFEGFPMVLLEAMACGLPIVSFKCPEGPGTLLQNGGGLLVPPENTDLLSESILKLIRSELLRNKLANEASSVIGQYTPQNIYSLWSKLFEKLILESTTLK